VTRKKPPRHHPPRHLTDPPLARSTEDSRRRRPRPRASAIPSTPTSGRRTDAHVVRSTWTLHSTRHFPKMPPCPDSRPPANGNERLPLALARAPPPPRGTRPPDPVGPPAPDPVNPTSSPHPVHLHRAETPREGGRARLPVARAPGPARTPWTHLPPRPQEFQRLPRYIPAGPGTRSLPTASIRLSISFPTTRRAPPLPFLPPTPWPPQSGALAAPQQQPRPAPPPHPPLARS
jgi:hypothetical protein